MARGMNWVVLEVQSPAGCLYRIEADKHGFHCFEQAFDAEGNEAFDEDGEPKFKPMAASHFGKLEGACKRLLEEGLRAEDNFAIGALIARMSEWTQRIVEAVRGRA